MLVLPPNECLSTQPSDHGFEFPGCMDVFSRFLCCALLHRWPWNVASYSFRIISKSIHYWLSNLWYVNKMKLIISGLISDNWCQWVRFFNGLSSISESMDMSNIRSKRDVTLLWSQTDIYVIQHAFRNKAPLTALLKTILLVTSVEGRSRLQ